MEDDAYTHFIAIGACYIDTILTVPAYPREDAKQRASSITKRRGGNCPNTLEVLQQLFVSPFLQNSHDGLDNSSVKVAPKLILLSTLPRKDSPDTNFIADSFDIGTTSSQNETKCPVDLHYAFHRTETTAASSYIVQSESTNSRTIVNYNNLQEMTLSEFQNAISAVTASTPTTSNASIEPHDSQRQSKRIWFHFEGRIPDISLECIIWLKATFSSLHSPSHPYSSQNSTNKPKITISIESEKPLREGLEQLAELADVVFYSRSWAEGQGYTTAEQCLHAEAARISGVRKGRAHHGPSNDGKESEQLILCCTWGKDGASLLEINNNNTTRHDNARNLQRDNYSNDNGTEIQDQQETEFEDEEVRNRNANGNGNSNKPNIVSLPAWQSPTEQKVIDTIGAGDTWIAGMLYSFMRQPKWDARRRVAFANEVAGRKVLREGFGGLGREMMERGNKLSKPINE